MGDGRSYPMAKRLHGENRNAPADTDGNSASVEARTDTPFSRFQSNGPGGSSGKNGVHLSERWCQFSLHEDSGGVLHAVNFDIVHRPDDAIYAGIVQFHEPDCGGNSLRNITYG